MSCKITELLNKIEEVKTKITDASYIDLINSISQIKKDDELKIKRICRLKRKAFKLHWQLYAVTDYAVAQEYDSDSGPSDLVFVDTF